MILFKAVQTKYLSSWADYTKTSSFRNGARWNKPNVPALYTSANVQNAMLEIANYSLTPSMANSLYTMAVFEFPELRLKTIEPAELPAKWSHRDHKLSVKNAGNKYLTSKDWEGIVVPSVTIHHAIATHPINAIRQSVYANVIVNLEQIGIDNIKLIDTFSPIYSEAMFA